MLHLDGAHLISRGRSHSELLSVEDQIESRFVHVKYAEASLERLVTEADLIQNEVNTILLVNTRRRLGIVPR